MGSDAMGSEVMGLKATGSGATAAGVFFFSITSRGARVGWLGFFGEGGGTREAWLRA
jgi:hypothetical protein